MVGLLKAGSLKRKKKTWLDSPLLAGWEIGPLSTTVASSCLAHALALLPSLLDLLMMPHALFLEPDLLSPHSLCHICYCPRLDLTHEEPQSPDPAWDIDTPALVKVGYGRGGGVREIEKGKRTVWPTV